MIEMYGWYGVVAVVLAYALNNSGILTVHDTPYIILNLSGGIGLLLDNYLHRAYQSMVANFIWVVIALFGLTRVIPFPF